MKHSISTLRIFTLLIILFAIVVFAPPPLLHAQFQDDIQIQSKAFELEVIRLVNQERISRGLHPLKYNSNLSNAARAHNLDMISNNFFNHTGSNGSTPDERACLHGYTPYGSGCFVGENIAAGYATPLAVFNGWMTSKKGHKENMLDPRWREVGAGHTTGGSWGHYWTMDFGAQPDVLPVFINGIDEETASRNVTLTLTDEFVTENSNAIITITNVKISEDPTFAGASWQSWTGTEDDPFVTMPFTLSSACNGEKTIYVKYTDGVKEIVSSDTIVLNEATSTPCLEVSPLNLPDLILFEAGTGKTVPQTLLVDIKNINTATPINWTATGSESWLNPVSNSGTSPATLEISLATPGVGAGNTVSAQLTVSTADAGVLQPSHTITFTVKVVDKIHEIFLPVMMK